MSITVRVLHWICTLLIFVGFQMALYWQHFNTGSTVDYLVDYVLVNAWDIESVYDLPRLLYGKLALYDDWTSRDLDLFFHYSRRMSALGQDIQADEIHNILQSIYCAEIPYPMPKQPNYGNIFKFLINQGADIECRDSVHMETALLVAAESDYEMSLGVIQELLWLDADDSAVDYKGRGPLHLTLKPSRIFAVKDLRSSFFRVIKDKSVHLLQTGCSIHAVDNYGRTPTDVARIWRRTKPWEAALQEIGKLECARSKCQCEIIVSLPRLTAVPRRGLRLLRKLVTDAQLTFTED